MVSMVRVVTEDPNNVGLRRRRYPARFERRRLTRRRGLERRRREATTMTRVLLLRLRRL
jgi:hypothetical protein